MSTTQAVVRRDGFKVSEVAAAMGVVANTIYGQIYEGTISAIRIGRSVRIPRSELVRLGYPIPEVEVREVSGR